jgi:hypothetical protein
VFFFHENTKKIVFRCIDGKRNFIYKSKRGRIPHHKTRPKETSLGKQLANTTSQAPASAYIHASAFIVSSKEATKGCVAILPNSPRCKQITNEVPLCSVPGMDRIAFAHQSAKPLSRARGWVGSRSNPGQHTSCQLVLAKGQSMKMCDILSSNWCGNPWRASRSAVHYLSR